MIQKIFAYKKNKSAIWLASIGTIVGLSILFLSIQLYVDIKSLSSQSNNLIHNDYFVIKKNVSELSSFGINNNSFSNQELEAIANKDFVKSMAVFQGCRYKVFVQLSEKGGAFPEFSTLAYFESIPDKFIDIKTNSWSWSNSDSLVPIILPSTYLDAYNFGIALSMGTPQLSKKLLSTIPFKLIIEGNQKRKIYYSKVIGFSDRINSILVPNAFLSYTNKIYGNSKISHKSQLIIETNNAQDPEIAKFLKKHNYQTNQELIKENKIQELLKSGLSYQLFISLIIIFQSILLLIFYNRILINKSKDEIKTLLMLGYTINSISKSINIIITKYYLIMVLISCGIVFTFKKYINYWFLTEKQIELPTNINAYTFITGVLFVVLFIFINSISTKKRITQIAC